ncbi:hypothetical protein GCM10010171_05710 [Actinokineospora fastidiosa]|uniref:Uncharacterized protein n=1 Tax=Actinokineospora fastidiosa TaxID=1816 RepID=A0A918G325_9PSEU|nr:hypothetical protein GCM10010171_05710 [Actinokineospora fastidiosa]
MQVTVTDDRLGRECEPADTDAWVHAVARGRGGPAGPQDRATGQRCSGESGGARPRRPGRPAGPSQRMKVLGCKRWRSAVAGRLARRPEPPDKGAPVKAVARGRGGSAGPQGRASG